MQDRPVIVVTGASRGLGRALAHWLGRAGCAVALMARSARGLSEAAEEVEHLGGEAAVFSGDVADPGDAHAAVTGTLERFGRLDGLVNNAGIAEPLAMVADSNPEAWLRNLKVNLFGPYALARAALPELRTRRGRVVNVSSGAAQLALPAASAYCASKAALTHLTRVLAAEEPEVVSVALRPGVVDTDMQAVLRKADAHGMPSEQAAYYRGLRERGELIPPSLPARSAAWLVLKAPRHLSGRFVSYDDPEIAGPAESDLGVA